MAMHHLYNPAEADDSCRLRSSTPASHLHCGRPANGAVLAMLTQHITRRSHERCRHRRMVRDLSGPRSPGEERA